MTAAKVRSRATGRINWKVRTAGLEHALGIIHAAGAQKNRPFPGMRVMNHYDRDVLPVRQGVLIYIC
jgi:hypothetical protein